MFSVICDCEEKENAKGERTFNSTGFLEYLKMLFANFDVKILDFAKSMDVIT